MLMRDEVAAYIAGESLLTPGARVVAAVSGGPDSLCLLDCLQALDFDVRVAHLDHGLRRGSWNDARFVLDEARRRGLPAIVERLSPSEWRGRGTSVEEAARLARYRFLVRAARAWQATTIATGHTADDQAETVLMHFLRGAGTHGLRGMLPRTPLGDWAELPEAGALVLIRPLLAIWRWQTEAHCRSAGLRPRRDRTNDDPVFFRNRLRHRLLPELEGYNPRVREALNRTAEVLRQEAELFDALAAGAQADVVRFPTGASATFSRQQFLEQPIALQRALISAAAHRLTPAQRDFGFSAVELARRRIGEPSTGRRTPLPGGLELVDEGDRLRLSASVAPVRYPDMPQLLTFEPIHVTPPARLELQDGWLALLPGAAPNARVARRSADLEDPLWLDQDALEATIIVRPPQPGDRMQPLGMRGHRKLSDIFNSLRVPVGARALWPVVTSREVIVGVAGLRIGQAARLTRATRRALELRYDAAEGPPR